MCILIEIVRAEHQSLFISGALFSSVCCPLIAFIFLHFGFVWTLHKPHETHCPYMMTSHFLPTTWYVYPFKILIWGSLVITLLPHFLFESLTIAKIITYFKRLHFEYNSLNKKYRLKIAARHIAILQICNQTLGRIGMLVLQFVRVWTESDGFEIWTGQDGRH